MRKNQKSTLVIFGTDTYQLYEHQFVVPKCVEFQWKLCGNEGRPCLHNDYDSRVSGVDPRSHSLRGDLALAPPAALGSPLVLYPRINL